MAQQDPASNTARRRLGRGLGSLIGATARVDARGSTAPAPEQSQPTDDSDSAVASDGPTSTSAIEPKPAADGEMIRSIPVTSIIPNRRQPRQDFDEDSIVRLAESIRKAGLMQPIVVRPEVGKPGQFELIAGERRWRAAQRLSMAAIPAVVRTVDDRTAAEWSLIENLQREDLNPMDRAAAFAKLISEFGLSHQEIADEIGLERSTISNLLRLNDLDATTSAAVRAGHLSLGHAKALLGCADASVRSSLATAAIRHGWSVRKTESEVRQLATDTSYNSTRTASSAVKSGGEAHLGRLEEQIGALLGTRVKIERGKAKGAGRLVIDYYSIEQFEGLLERMNLAGALVATSR